MHARKLFRMGPGNLLGCREGVPPIVRARILDDIALEGTAKTLRVHEMHGSLAIHGELRRVGMPLPTPTIRGSPNDRP